MRRFVAYRILQGRPYPNLAQHPAEPYTVPVELSTHCEPHSYPFELTATGEYTHSNDRELHWYPAQWRWFSFEIDYFALLPPEVRRILADNTRNLKMLFYYHESDNPAKIKERLDHLCLENELSPGIYRLVSGNTAADAVKNCVHFSDHELLYYMRNKDIVAKHVKFLKTGVAMRQLRENCFKLRRISLISTVIAGETDV